ncbi:hypothetical protein [Mycolicibacterium brisbanense]
MIPAGELAELDQARARADQALDGNLATFRQVVAESGEDVAMMQDTVTLAKMSSKQLGGMLAIAMARLARRDEATGG